MDVRAVLYYIENNIKPLSKHNKFMEMYLITFNSEPIASNQSSFQRQFLAFSEEAL